MDAKLQELKTRLKEINDLTAAAALLEWDQATYMPPGGSAARGRQSATLNRLAQEKLIDPTIGVLLDELQPWAEGQPDDSSDARLIRLARRQYERAIKVPPEFVAQFYAHISQSYQAWTKARPQNDFQAVLPMLEKTLDYSRRYAEFFPGYDHPADPWIDQYDYGMQANTIKQLFAQLRQALVPLVDAITAQPPADDSFLKQHFPEEQQLQFGLPIIKQFGYNLERGRQDKSPHPFSIKFSLDDVRITTRVNPNDLTDALFSTLHEAGHALYEQGIDSEFEATPLGTGTSSGVHESSSRLWENVVGRSLGFWQHYYPRLQETFPQQLGDVSLDAFYRAINKVQRSLIRTDADEVTYNLHVMIRFDLELAMLEGDLQVKDLPDAWHARYESDLGLRAPSDVDGVLQDVHWYAGPIGGVFQGYTLGNIISALLYSTALDAHPDIPAEIAQGQFDTLGAWLKENVYQHGSKYDTNELIARLTGGPLTIEPYIQYLRAKYGQLYQL